MNSVLEAKHINKYFKKPLLFHVLKNISFKIKKGEFASIMGSRVVGNRLYCIFYQLWIPIMTANCI